MRAAPALDANLDNARPERVLIVMLHLLAGLVWLAWGRLHASPDLGWGAQLVVCAAVALACVGLGRLLANRALPAAPGRILWTGQHWVLRGQADQVLHQVQVRIDLGSWLLLCLQTTPTSALRWRIARQRSAGPAWHALRVALQAHAGPAAQDDAARGRAT